MAHVKYLAIDPGLSTGWALLDAWGDLVGCGNGQDWPAGIDRAIIELPQVYRPGMSHAKPENLITLAVRVGQYKERLEVSGAVVLLEKPATWKGQVPKSVHHPRIRKALLPSEIPAMLAGLRGVTAKRSEDVWDAIGLAKWAFANGRFANGRLR